MIKPEKIADAAEVLEYLTACMRAGSGGMKAAELLARRYGLLSEQAAAAEVPHIIDDIAPADDAGDDAGDEEGGAADE